MIYRVSMRNSPFIGVYVAAGGGVAIVPPAAPEGFVSKLANLTDLKVLRSTIGSVSAVGAMVVMNSNGIAVPRNIIDEELSELKGADLPIVVVGSRLNCLGNLVCANDCGAIASPLFPREAIAQLREALGVEVCQLTVAGYNIVGSAMVATDRGALTHTSLTEEEKETLQDLLKVKVDTGTVNGGFPFVRAGIVSGQNGVLVGDTTTGPELMILREALASE